MKSLLLCLLLALVCLLAVNSATASMMRRQVPLPSDIDENDEGMMIDDDEYKKAKSEIKRRLMEIIRRRNNGQKMRRRRGDKVQNQSDELNKKIYWGHR
ncbi:unnamed protein product [Mesocestoides corti]|uniref:BZIP domain-containing protein n=1 Tax=Mesocestoides corti TaxID=53468 RepID=A0A0R3UCP3_MESCO|nr:unnamed protein product [Mesocestoides corti]